MYFVDRLVIAMTAAAFAPAASLAQEAPLKIGVVTFLSGPAASPFGVPARNAAEIMVEPPFCSVMAWRT